jgi:zinc transporter, ZIP family
VVWYENGALTLAGRAFVASLLAGLASGLGGLLVVLLPRISRRIYDTLLGFSAGVMFSASALALLWPALQTGSLLSVTLGLFAGGLLILALERAVPHLEPHFAPELDSRSARFGLLLAAAITLHNLPEGLAIGVAYAHGEGRFGLVVALAIAAQNIPEGSAVALPFYAKGSGRAKALLWATLSGLVQPVAAAAGFHLVALTHGVVPFGLASAAGAMVYVASYQLVPESHSEPGRKAPSLALLAGFLLVAVLLRWLG